MAYPLMGGLRILLHPVQRYTSSLKVRTTQMSITLCGEARLDLAVQINKGHLWLSYAKSTTE